MANHRWRRLLVALSGVAILAVAGCGSSTTKTPTSSTTPTTTSTRQTPPSRSSGY